MENVTAVILAGGQSKRMGRNKAFLTFQGKSFINLLIEELQQSFPLCISCNSMERYDEYKMKKIFDLYDNIGPIGGIYSALASVETTYIWVVSCDTPLISKKLGRFLSTYISSEYDCYIPITRKGKVCPTLGIYHKKTESVFKEMIECNDYKMMNLLKKLNVKYIPLEYTEFSEESLRNINYIDDYELLKRTKKKPYIIAVSGVKNSGKTTLITKLIPEFRKRDNKIATIKHDGHEFLIDEEGTDTFKHLNSGADGAAIFSQNQFKVMIKASSNEELLKEYFKGFDIIILEGFKNSNYPKIEVVREGVSKEIVCKKETLIAIVSNTISEFSGIPVFGLEEIEKICSFIERNIEVIKR